MKIKSYLIGIGEDMKNAVYLVACMACLASVCMGKDLADSGSPQVQVNRSAYLDDLIQPHRYSAGKNSFILQRLASGRICDLCTKVLDYRQSGW